MRAPQFAVAAVMALAVLALAACASAPPPKKELTAQEIVDKAGDKMKELKSVHFRLELTDGKMALGPGITVENIEGDAASPGRMRISTKATIMGMVTEIELIGVEGRQYLRNPLTKRWEAAPISLAGSDLFAPEGAPSIMKSAKNLARLEDEAIDGAESYHVKGTVESGLIAALVGGAPSNAQVQVEMWIGTADFFVRQIKLAGPLLQDDAAKIVRTLKLSKFNEPVTIEPPA